MSVAHYENFPVASVLCPAALRPAVVALYRYARTADDMADEGTATPDERRAELQRYRAALLDALGSPAVLSDNAWPQVFGPLSGVVARFGLPTQPLLDLLDAFLQDTHNPSYPTRALLLDYCRGSANPVGRMLLHLYGVHDERSLTESDAICTALQLINFWQDFSRDHPKGRCYIPHEDARDHGLDPAHLARLRDSPATQALVKSLVGWARATLKSGHGLPLRLAGRIGWELRLVVQGGHRILDKIEAMDHRSLQQRPRLRPWDVPVLIWHAAKMRA